MNTAIHTVECARGHQPIIFEGHFVALCPLCQALSENVETKITKSGYEATIQELEEEIESAERRAEAVSQEYAAYRSSHP